MKTGDEGAGKPTPAEVFNHAKALRAIDAAIGLFGEMGLTVAEMVHVVSVLNETVKAKYPEVYELVTSEYVGQVEEDGD